MKQMMVEERNLRWPVCPGAILIRIVLSALAATLGVAAAQPTHGAETMRWKFTPGETLRYTMVQETTQGMKAMGQEFKTSLNQTVDLHWSVKNVASDGVAELSQTIDRVRTKVEGPGNSFEFDSQGGSGGEREWHVLRGRHEEPDQPVEPDLGRGAVRKRKELDAASESPRPNARHHGDGQDLHLRWTFPQGS